MYSQYSSNRLRLLEVIFIDMELFGEGKFSLGYLPRLPILYMNSSRGDLKVLTFTLC